MQYHVSTKNFEPSDKLHIEVEKKRQKVAKLVEQFPQDVVHLDLTMERQARREEYAVSLRLGLTGTVLVARDRGTTPETALHKAVAALETEIGHYKAKLRHDGAVKRQREGVSALKENLLEGELLDERELIDRSLAGDEAAFSTLTEEYMPELMAAVRTEAARRGFGEPDDEELREVVEGAMARALQSLPQEPAQADLRDWLAGVAVAAWRDHVGETA